MDRNKQLRINSICSIGYQIVSLICGFILPKLIIGTYSSAINGLLSSISQFLGIISLCELGMGAVVPASLYKPLAQKDDEQISRIVVSSERFYRKIAIGMLVYVAILTFCYPFVVDEFSFLFTSSLILIIASSSFAQYYFGVTYSLLITADQRQYISYCLNAVIIVGNLVLTYILIKLGCSIHIVKLTSSIVFIARPWFYTYYVKHHYNIDKKIRIYNEPIKQKWNGVAQHIAYTIQEKSGFLILSLMSTLENVSIYSIYYLILESLRGLVYSLTSSLTSYLGNIIAKGEDLLLKSSFGYIEWSIHTITVLLFTCAAVLIVPFISVYTEGITDANYIVNFFPMLLCSAIAVRCLQMPYNIVVQAAGHFKETQSSAILEPIINVIVSISLTLYLGLSGVAIGMLVSMVYRMLYLALYLTKHILYSSVLQLMKRLVVDIVIAATIIILSSQFKLADISYISWIFLSLKIGMVSLLITITLNYLVYRDYTKKIAYKLCELIKS